MARATSRRIAWGVLIALATIGCSAPSLVHAESGIELKGKKLFERATFGGNGRTCRTCHSKRTGTLTLADVQRIIHKARPTIRS